MRNLITILSLSVMSLTAHGLSLQESMKIAFERNPKTQANDLRLKAMEERTRAAWLAFMPTFDVSYNLGRNQSAMNAGQGWQSSNSTSRSLSYGLSFNIYDGGVRYYNAKSAEAGEKARAAQFNSTDSRIPNTRGAIAGQVFNSYTNILRVQEEALFTKELREAYLQILKVAKSPDEKKRVKSAIASQEARLSDLKFQLEDAARDFENVVKIPMPSQMDDYSATEASIVIPDNPQNAIETALKKSPELNVASYQLEQMQLDYKAERRAITRPQINGHISKSHGNSKAGEDAFNTRSSGSSIGVTLSWSFSASRNAYNRASALEVEALQKDKDGALEDLKFNIESAYPKLANYAKNAESYSQILQDGYRDLEDVLKRIDKGEDVKVDDAFGLTNVLQNNFYPAVMAKQSLLTAKFDLQKTIGTLFDQVRGRSFPNN